MSGEDCIGKHESRVSDMHSAIMDLKEAKEHLGVLAGNIRGGDVPQPVCESAKVPIPPLAELLESGPSVIRSHADDINALIRDLRDMLL